MGKQKCGGENATDVFDTQVTAKHAMWRNGPAPVKQQLWYTSQNNGGGTQRTVAAELEPRL